MSTPAPEGRPLDLVHRDVKPANIRLTPAGEVKLLDFGVARGELSTREAHTRSVAFGSLPYMAPERLLGHDTAAGDVYALGLVLVEALTRVRAHESAPRKPQWHDSFRVEASAMVDAALHAEGIDHSIRAAVVSLCERMLAFAPEDRPTAREAAREARRLAGRVDWPDPREWCAEHVPYAPLATVGEVTTILRERGAVEAPEDPAPPSTPMKRPAMSGAHLLAGVGMVGVLALGALLVLGGVGVWWSFRDPGPPASDARPHDPPQADPASAAPVSAPPPAPTPSAEPGGERREPAPPAEVGAAGEAPRPTRARVSATGAAEVWLLRAGHRIELGRVAAGDYTVMARFDGEPVVAGSVVVPASGSLALVCDESWGTCR